MTSDRSARGASPHRARAGQDGSIEMTPQHTEVPEQIRHHALTLLAVAQNGLTYVNDPYDRQRYEQVRRCAEELMGLISDGELVLDHEKQGHRPHLPFHVYKLLFLCRERSRVTPDPNETTAIEWFRLDALPPLSPGRVLEPQLHLLHTHWLNPTLATVFD